MKFSIAILSFSLICLFNACHNARGGNDVYPDCSSTDIEKVDTCLLGLTVRQVIEKLKLDTLKFSTIQEPIAVLRGISYMPDSLSLIELFVERTPIKARLDSANIAQRDSVWPKHLYRFIEDKPILTVRWIKDNGRREKVVSKGN